MAKRDLQNHIKMYQGVTLVEGTNRMEDLLAHAWQVMKDYNLRTPLAKEIDEILEYNREAYASPLSADYHSALTVKDYEEANWIWEKVCDYFDEVAPKGYYFGTLEGDGACLGWFKELEDMYA